MKSPDACRFQIMDYTIQMHRLLPLVAAAYGFHFTGQSLMRRLRRLEREHVHGEVFFFFDSMLHLLWLLRLSEDEITPSKPATVLVCLFVCLFAVVGRLSRGIAKCAACAVLQRQLLSLPPFPPHPPERK